MSTSPSQSPQRILIVDDETHILQVLSLKLRNAGYEVNAANDGEEGLEMAINNIPDLVITDFQMPYMTGLEMCKGLASYESTAKIPVLMLTARGYSLDDSDLADVNIKEVIHKPFSPRAVLETVQQILASHTAELDSNSESQAA